MILKLISEQRKSQEMQMHLEDVITLKIVNVLEMNKLEKKTFNRETWIKGFDWRN